MELDAILAELRAIRTALDKLAAHVVGEQTKRELMPIWDCGHRHASRGEAIRCKHERANGEAGAVG